MHATENFKNAARDTLHVIPGSPVSISCAWLTSRRVHVGVLVVLLRLAPLLRLPTRCSLLRVMHVSQPVPFGFHSFPAVRIFSWISGPLAFACGPSAFRTFSITELRNYRNCRLLNFDNQFAILANQYLIL